MRGLQIPQRRWSNISKLRITNPQERLAEHPTKQKERLAEHPTKQRGYFMLLPLQGETNAIL